MIPVSMPNSVPPKQAWMIVAWLVIDFSLSEAPRVTYSRRKGKYPPIVDLGRVKSELVVLDDALQDAV